MSSKKSYFEYLDILRFFSFFLVFTYHSTYLNNVSFFEKYCQPLFSRFIISVGLFFTLSSFLLTFLAVNEYAKYKKFNQINFIIRRGLRIYPLYFFFVALVYIAVPWVAKKFGVTHITMPPVGWYLFFVNNYYTQPCIFLLHFLWTVAAEEQFYITYSFILKYFYKYLKFICGLMFVSFFICKYFGCFNTNIFHTLNYLPFFASGALAAMFFVEKKDWLMFFISKQKIFFWILLYSFFAYFLFFAESLYYFHWYMMIDNIVVSIIFGLIILHLSCISKQGRYNKVESFLVFLGKRTYSLYIFHGMVLTIFFVKISNTNINHFWALIYVSTLCITYLIALISYRFIEQPFLKMKNKFIL